MPLVATSASPATTTCRPASRRASSTALRAWVERRLSAAIWPTPAAADAVSALRHRPEPEPSRGEAFADLHQVSLVAGCVPRCTPLAFTLCAPWLMACTAARPVDE